MTANTRQAALAQIVEIALTHDISPKEITDALTVNSDAMPRNKALIFFSALGGIFIFSGIVAFIGMFWDDMNSAARVTITLGSGFALFVMGIVAAQTKDILYQRASTPLLIIAGWLQPGGLFVLINEYFHKGGDPRYACLVVFGVMLVQQLATFIAVQRSVLLFFALLYGSSFFATVFNLMDVPNEWTGVIIGTSLLNISYALSKMDYRNIPGLGFFFGGAVFFSGAFALLHHSPIELIYLGLTCFMVYLSTVVRSAALMFVSVIAMLSYIGYFTEEHFVHSIGWPAALIVLGFIFIGTGVGAMKIKRKYI